MIIPTESALKNFMSSHPQITEKWEAYAEICRSIISECGGFEKSEKTYNDHMNHYYILNDMKKNL